MQVANQTHDGKLVLLETSTASILTLDTRTGTFKRVVSLPDGAVPNYATWGPEEALFVTQYGQGIVWKVPHGSRRRRSGSAPRRCRRSSSAPPGSGSARSSATS